MHDTPIRKEVKKLYVDIREIDRRARIARRAARHTPEAKTKARELESQAKEKLNEICALSTQARLEDLSVWVMEKTKATKKGNKTYSYWMASWRDKKNCLKVRNVHLGSCAKIDKETAMQKARQIKAEYLGVSLQ